MTHRLLSPKEGRRSTWTAGPHDGQCPGAGVVSVFEAGSTQGTIGINGAGFASGPAKRTAIAPRNAPVSEWVTSG